MSIYMCYNSIIEVFVKRRGATEVGPFLFGYFKPHTLWFFFYPKTWQDRAMSSLPGSSPGVGGANPPPATKKNESEVSL